jgi:type IV pilus assembly protein PilC
MQYFLFTAVDRSGEIQTGTMPAMNIAELDDRLSQNGLDLIRCKVPLAARVRSVFNRAGIPGKAQAGSAGSSKPGRKELINFTFNLEQLLTAGVPLRDALEDFARGGGDDAQRRMQSVTLQLIESIDSGKKLSEACSRLPGVFTPLYTSMVAVGEQTGNLAEVMRDLGVLLRWNDETISRIQRVLIYPAFVTLVLLLVIGFVMTWLVPGLMSFLTSTGGELPWHSKALISVSDFFVEYGLILLLLFAVIVVASVFFLNKSPRLAIVWQRAVLRAPLVGSVLFHIRLARFCRCAALMYASGISLLDALKQCELVLDNQYLAAEVAAIRQRIVEGKSVSDCFFESQVFPPMIARMIRVGESTGAMEKSFEQISYFYDRQSNESIETLEQSLGPALIMIVGSVMLWVVVSVIGPIYDLVFSMGASF